MWKWQVDACLFLNKDYRYAELFTLKQVHKDNF